MKRLATLYRLVHNVRALELGVASAALAEVERAARDTAQTHSLHRKRGQDALGSGDSAAWAYAQTCQQISELRTQRLNALTLEREALREDALRRHRESSVQMEQTESAVERTRLEAEKQLERRMQAEGDDRFLSRRQWVRSEADRRPLAALE